MTTSLKGAGIGLRASHCRDFIERSPPAGWLEVHSENYFGDGGYDLFVLDRVRERYPVSLHGVGLALGSAPTAQDLVRLDHHLGKLKRLVDRIQPAEVSEHMCWGAHGGRQFNDLLPLPYTRGALDHTVARVQHMQEVLGRRILIENVSSYVEFLAGDYSETGFLRELASRSGCGVLLDVNNLYVNQVNHGTDAREAMAALSPGSVAEIHLAGHATMGDVLIDDHGSPVADPVWRLFDSALELFGPVPTLIEWDTDVPELEVLLGQARLAAARMSAAHA